MCLRTLQTQPWGQWNVCVGSGCCRNTPRWLGRCRRAGISTGQSFATSLLTAWSTTGPHLDSTGCTKTRCSLCRRSRTLDKGKDSAFKTAVVNKSYEYFFTLQYKSFLRNIWLILLLLCRRWWILSPCYQIAAQIYKLAELTRLFLLWT